MVCHFDSSTLQFVVILCSIRQNYLGPLAFLSSAISEKLRGVQTLLGDHSFVKQGGHRVRHQQQRAVNTSEKREGAKTSQKGGAAGSSLQ